MKDRIALITGATSGIGRETAKTFAKHGVKIAAVGRDENKGISLVNEIKEQGMEAYFIRADIGKSAEISQMMKETIDYFGKIDFAVNNAGIEGNLAPIAETEEEDWDILMNINLKGLWLCMKHEIDVMAKNGGGVIVNVSTHLTEVRKPNTGIYTASKAGVEILTEIAAVENGPQGIRINSIKPGAVDTPMLRRIYSNETLQEIGKNNPLGKIAMPIDIANAIFWLCSPESGHVNGTSFTIDGGA